MMNTGVIVITIIIILLILTTTTHTVPKVPILGKIYQISVTISMTTMETCRVLAKTGAERSVDDFVSLRTAMK